MPINLTDNRTHYHLGYNFLIEGHSSDFKKQFTVAILAGMLIMQGERDYQVTMEDHRIWKSIKEQTNWQWKL
jgi:hypothetical protein